jgi:queuine/archaeosine tRNA-ribosyltransferase
VKGLTTEQLEALDCHVILGNTYHLGHRYPVFLSCRVVCCR